MNQQNPSLDDVPDVIPLGQVYRFGLDEGEPRSALPAAAPTYSSVMVTDEEVDGGYYPCTVVWSNGNDGRGVCIRANGHDGHHADVCDDENGDERVVAVWGNHPEHDVPYDVAVLALGMEDFLHRFTEES